MIRRVLSAIPLAVLVACSGTETTAPNDGAPSGPSLAISDGAHANPTGIPQNPDAFFLFPLVLPTSSYANWTPNGFNKSLSPTIVVCPLNVTTVAAVTPTTACKPAGGGFPVTIDGANVKKHFRTGSEPTNLPANVEDLVSHYHAEWKVPNPCNIVYRLTLKVGDAVLGFADVHCVNTLLGLLTVDYKKFGAGLRGTFVQIPVRVERWALCAVPGVGPCGSTTVATATGGETTVLLPGGTAPSGVTIPAQGTGGSTPPALTVTVEPCPSLNPRATDIPVFGPCLRVTTTPALPPAGLAVAATVFVCDVQVIEGVHVLDHDQEHRITMHRLDEVGATQTVVSLPHTNGCPVTSAAVPASFKGIFRELVQGNLKAAGGQALSMIGPKPLYAARRLNLGAGGLTRGFSDFQVGLGCALSKDSGDNQSGQPGAQLANPATVVCLDVGGEPVRGARVKFQASAGGLPNPEVAVITGNDGKASTPWTLASTAGLNSLSAKGRGLAGTDFNGPRCGIDPFQPIQIGVLGHPEFGNGSPCGDGESNGTPDAEVLVKTGSVGFSAIGTAESIGEGFFDFGSGGYSSKQIAQSDPSPMEPLPWYSENFNALAAGFTIGTTSSFGSPGGCGNTPDTPWAVDTDLLVRKKFSLASAQQIVIRIAIDNNLIDVYLNGVKLNAETVTHGGCAIANEPDNTTFTAAGLAGTNTLAIRARDTGVEAFLDIKISPLIIIGE